MNSQLADMAYIAILKASYALMANNPSRAKEILEKAKAEIEREMKSGQAL